MDLKVPIALFDELAESVIKSTGLLDLASGEIRNVVYEDYDVKALGLPADNEEYEFTSGTLSNDGKDVEFGVQVDVFSGKYSVNASELLEIKLRAAKLFAGVEGQSMLAEAAAAQKPPAQKTAKPPKPPGGGRGPRKMH